MNMETKLSAEKIEFKFVATETEQETGQIEGYGAVFGNTDSYGDVIIKGAFARSLMEHRAAGTMPMMLVGHDMSKLPVGIWESMEEDDFGLKLAGSFLPTSVGQDARLTAKVGQITGLSIGYMVTDYKMENGLRLLTGIKLVEVSLVNMPANELAQVTNIKSEDTSMEDNTMSIDVSTEPKRLNELLGELKAAFDQIQMLQERLNAEVKTTADSISIKFFENSEQKDHPSGDAEQENKYDDAALLLAVKNIRTRWEKYV